MREPAAMPLQVIVYAYHFFGVAGGGYLGSILIVLKNGVGGEHRGQFNMQFKKDIKGAFTLPVRFIKILLFKSSIFSCSWRGLFKWRNPLTSLAAPPRSPALQHPHPAGSGPQGRAESSRSSRGWGVNVAAVFGARRRAWSLFRPATGPGPGVEIVTMAGRNSSRRTDICTLSDVIWSFCAKGCRENECVGGLTSLFNRHTVLKIMISNPYLIHFVIEIGH